MKKIYLFLLFAILFTACKVNNQWQIGSPNGNIEVSLWQEENGQLYYAVHLHKSNKPIEIVQQSQLGIIRNDAVFAENLKFIKSESQSNIVHEYNMIKGKRLQNKAKSNRLELIFENEENKPLNIIFEVFNDGVGLKYLFPDKSDNIHIVLEELTEFAMPIDGYAWIQPYDTLDTWSPAYEYGYMQRMKIGTLPPLSTGWGFPALFETNGAWMLISETGLDGTYCGSHLSANCADGVYRVEYPFEWENYGMWNANPKNKLPWETPWRIIIIGDNPGTILESNLPNHLALENRIHDTNWIKPGISSWNWWGDHSGGWKFNSLKEHIDLSVEMGWQYSLVDAEWQDMKGGTLEELAEYAAEKGIELSIWYNSGGPHSRVMDALPRDLMHIPEVRRAEMKRIREMGIRGIKVDFFQGDKQGTIQYYIDIIKDAADNELWVNTHGCTIPRGWDRTFPNLITMEAVRGAELYSWHMYPEQAVWQNTILPFTRNVLGSMDYTPVTFSDYTPEIKHITTNAHELALSVIFESGVQHFADRAESYRAQPKPVIDFLKNVPVVWDDTYFIDGYPGEFVIMARERESVFYVAGINGTMNKKSVSFKMPFLDNNTSYKVEIIKDGDHPRIFAFDAFTINGNDEFNIDMLPAGGFSAKLTRM